MRRIEDKGLTVNIDTLEFATHIATSTALLIPALIEKDNTKIYEAVVSFLNIFSTVNIKSKPDKLLWKFVTNCLKEATKQAFDYIPKEKFKQIKMKELSKQVSIKKMAIYVDPYLIERPGMSLISIDYIILSA